MEHTFLSYTITIFLISLVFIVMPLFSSLILLIRIFSLVCLIWLEVCQSEIFFQELILSLVCSCFPSVFNYIVRLLI